jgi:hypothetical protein
VPAGIRAKFRLSDEVWSPKTSPTTADRLVQADLPRARPTWSSIWRRLRVGIQPSWSMAGALLRTAARVGTNQPESRQMVTRLEQLGRLAQNGPPQERYRRCGRRTGFVEPRNEVYGLPDDFIGPSVDLAEPLADSTVHPRTLTRHSETSLGLPTSSSDVPETSSDAPTTFPSLPSTSSELQGPLRTVRRPRRAVRPTPWAVHRPLPAFRGPHRAARGPGRASHPSQRASRRLGREGPGEAPAVKSCALDTPRLPPIA